MKKNNLSRKKAIIIYTISSLAVICILSLIAIFNNGSSGKDGTPSDGRGEDVMTFDPNQIPSYLDLDSTMDVAVRDLYGKEYADLMVEGNEDTLRIPETQITFNRIEVGDAIDTMAVTAMAFLRNPYAKSVEHPIPLQVLIENTEGSERVLPDGGSIDLADVVQNYTDLKLSTSRGDSSKITVEGYCNGDYFTESINLMGLYEQYYIN